MSKCLTVLNFDRTKSRLKNLFSISLVLLSIICPRLVADQNDQFDTKLEEADRYKHSNPDSTLILLDKWDLLGDSFTDEQRIKGYALKTYVLIRMTRYDEAVKELEIHLELAESLDDQEQIAGVLNKRGLILMYTAEYDEAISYFRDSYNSIKDLDFPAVKVNALMNEGICFWYLKLFDQARSLYLRALAVAEENEMEAQVAALKLNIGSIESELGNYGEAIKYGLEANETFYALNNLYGIRVTHSSLGFRYLKVRNYSEAEFHSLKGLELERQAKDVQGEIRATNNLGIIYMEQARWEEALGYSSKALTLLENKNLKEDERIAYKNLYEVYKRTEKFDSALYYHERLTIVKDSIHVVEKEDIAQEAIEKFQRQQSDTSTPEKGNSDTLYVVLVVVLVGFAFYMFLRRAKGGQPWTTSDQSPSTQPSQIETKTRPESAFDKFEANKKMLGELDFNNGFNEKTWTSFLILFNTLYENFIERLSEMHPDITFSETRICMLTRLGLQNHEIADLLNITSDSVRKAKYRLYKKLDLNKEVELNHYLRSL